MEKFQALYSSWLDFFGPNLYLKALAIVLLFTVFAFIFNIFVIRLLKRLTIKTTFKGDDHLLEILRKPIFISLVIFGLIQAARKIELPEYVLSITESSLETIVIFIWTLFSIKFVRLVLEFVSAGNNNIHLIQKGTLPLFNGLAVLVVVATAIYFFFLAWGIDISAWLAGAGIIGIALSFAAKDTLANLFAGVFILADRPYKLGDYIVLDTGERGKVTHIGIRSTRLLTLDDIEVTVPNSVMGNAKIINETGGPTTKQRIRVKVGVAYGSDIDQIREILQNIAIENSNVCQEPEPRVRFRNFGGSSLDFELLCWVEMPRLRGRVLDELYCVVYKKFMEAGVEIPYAKQDVYIKSMPNSPIS